MMDVKTKVAKATLTRGCLSVTHWPSEGSPGFSKEDFSPFTLSLKKK